MTINIVTDPESGWDCIVNVYEDYFDIPNKFKQAPYIIHSTKLIRKNEVIDLTPKKSESNPYNIDYQRQTKINFEENENRS